MSILTGSGLSNLLLQVELGSAVKQKPGKEGTVEAWGRSEKFRNGHSLGILGIACIPELVWGIRKCSKYKIPVVEIPLNANRCMRWFGEFFNNSINLNELEKLVL